MKSAAKRSAVGCSHLVTLMEPLFTSPLLPQHFPGSVCACESSLHQVRLRCELSHYSAQAICFSFKASTQIFSFSSIIFIQFSGNLVVFSAKKKNVHELEMSRRDYWDYCVSFPRRPGHDPMDPVGII